MSFGGQHQGIVNVPGCQVSASAEPGYVCQVPDPYQCVRVVYSTEVTVPGCKNGRSNSDLQNLADHDMIAIELAEVYGLSRLVGLLAMGAEQYCSSSIYQSTGRLTGISCSVFVAHTDQ